MALILKRRSVPGSNESHWFWCDQSTHTQVGTAFPNKRKAVHWAREHAKHSQLHIPDAQLDWGSEERRQGMRDRRLMADRRDEIRFELGRRKSAGRRAADRDAIRGFSA